MYAEYTAHIIYPPVKTSISEITVHAHKYECRSGKRHGFSPPPHWSLIIYKYIKRFHNGWCTRSPPPKTLVIYRNTQR